MNQLIYLLRPTYDWVIDSDRHTAVLNLTVISAWRKLLQPSFNLGHFLSASGLGFCKRLTHLYRVLLLFEI